MTSNKDGGFVPPSAKRKLRTRDARRRIQRRQNIFLGIFVLIMTLVFVSLGVFNNRANGDLVGFDANLRGASDERSVWVSQKSQPFVSLEDGIFRMFLEKVTGSIDFFL